MPSLSHTRLLIARSALTRSVGLLLVWMMVIAGMPRWEVHAHAHDQGHDHSHSHLNGEHVDSGAKRAGDESGAVPHVHEVTTVSATVPPLMRLDVYLVAPNRWARPLHAADAPTVAGPPPHRPPIA